MATRHSRTVSVSVPTAERSSTAAPAQPAWRPASLTHDLTGGRFYLILILVALFIGAASLLIPSTPSYDPWSWLIWGREIIHLGLQTTGGPTWKPLPIVFITIFSLFGKAAPDLWLVVARAGAVMAAVMVFKVAATVVRLLAGGKGVAGIGMVELGESDCFAGLRSPTLFRGLAHQLEHTRDPARLTFGSHEDGAVVDGAAVDDAGLRRRPPSRAAEAVPGADVLLPAGRHRQPDPELRPVGPDRRAGRRRGPEEELRAGDEDCRPDPLDPRLSPSNQSGFGQFRR